MELSSATKDWLERSAKQATDMPSSHMEGMDLAKLKEMSIREAAVEVGKNYFSKEVENSAGTLEAFRELEKNANAEQFAKYYSEYVKQSDVLKKNNPEMYNFMRDRIFYGREYPAAPPEQRISFTGNDLRAATQEKAGGASHSGDLLSNQMQFREEDPDRKLRRPGGQPTWKPPVLY